MSTDLKSRDTKVYPYANDRTGKHDENFEDFVDNWRHHKNEIAIFLGAGASIGARNSSGQHLLSAYELRNEIWRQFMLKESEKDTYDFQNLSLVSLEHAASIAQARVDRKSIEDLVINRFTTNKALWQHAVIPFLNPTALFTTNYDNLIELGYGLHSGTPEVRQMVSVFNVNSYNKAFVPLFKPHGSITHRSADILHGGLVITQFDYFDVFSEREDMLNRFIEVLKDKCIIFIGYSFTDFDIALHIYKKAKLKDRPAWYAVFPRNDRHVRNMFLARYGIKQIDRTFFEFVNELDQHVNFIPSAWKFDKVKTDSALNTRIQGFD